MSAAAQNKPAYGARTYVSPAGSGRKVDLLPYRRFFAALVLQKVKGTDRTLKGRHPDVSFASIVESRWVLHIVPIGAMTRGDLSIPELSSSEC